VGGVESNTLYGTLNLLILQTLAREKLHGLAISRAIHDSSKEAVQVEEGALYPALHRLERDGLIEGEWGLSESRRRAKFYSLTSEGRKVLDREVEQWTEHANAVARVLELKRGFAK